MKSEIRNPKSELNLSGCAVVSAAAQERATPETDAAEFPVMTWPSQDNPMVVRSTVARRLERERDAARRDVAEMNARLIEEVASYLRTMEELRAENRRFLSERNDARNQLETIVAAFGLQEPVGEESCAEYVLRLLKKERDEARAALSGRTVSCSQCNQAAAENAAMREAVKESYEALDGCREDTCELMAEYSWWKDEPRCGYAARYQDMQSRVAAANAALAKLQPFIKLNETAASRHSMEGGATDE